MDNFKRTITFQLRDGDGKAVLEQWGKGIRIEGPEALSDKKHCRRMIIGFLQAAHRQLLKDYSLLGVHELSQEEMEEIWEHDSAIFNSTAIDEVGIEKIILELTQNKTLEEVAEEWFIDPELIKQKLTVLSHAMRMARTQTGHKKGEGNPNE